MGLFCGVGIFRYQIVAATDNIAKMMNYTYCPNQRPNVRQNSRPATRSSRPEDGQSRQEYLPFQLWLDESRGHVFPFSELSSDRYLICGLCKSIIYYDESHRKDRIQCIQCKICFHGSCSGCSGRFLATFMRNKCDQ